MFFNGESLKLFSAIFLIKTNLIGLFEFVYNMYIPRFYIYKLCSYFKQTDVESKLVCTYLQLLFSLCHMFINANLT